MGFTKATAAAAFENDAAMTLVFEGNMELVGKVLVFVGALPDDDPRLKDKTLLTDNSPPKLILAHLLQCWKEANSAVAPTAAPVAPPAAAGAPLAGPSAEAMFRELKADFAVLRDAVAEHSSATVAASCISPDKLRELRTVMNCRLLPVLDVLSVEELLARTVDHGAFGWSTGPGAPSEPQHAEQYEQHIKTAVSTAYQRLFPGQHPPRRVLWKDFSGAAAQTYKPPGARFSLSCKNDEVMTLSPSSPMVGLLGVELKKRLDMQAVYQAEAEFYVWDQVSEYPFCQLVTDLGRGGVAYYYEGRDARGTHIVRQSVLGSMPAVYDFIARLVHNIPEHLMKFEADAQGVFFPLELQAPKRMKLRHALAD